MVILKKQEVLLVKQKRPCFGGVMKILDVYTMGFDIEELKKLKCVKEYDLIEHKIDFVYQNIEKLPNFGVFILRNPQNCQNFWEYIKKVINSKKSICFFLLTSQKDFALVYEACRYSDVFVLEESAEKEEVEIRINECVARLNYISEVQKWRMRLEDYEYRKHHEIMERLLTNLIQKPEEVDFLLPEINKRYRTNLGKHNYLAVVINVNQYELCNKTSHFLKEVTLMILHILNLPKEIIVGYKEPYGLIAIVHYEDNDLNVQKKEEYINLWNEITTLKNRYGNFIITLSVGEMADSILDISESLEQAALVQDYRMTENKYILFTDEIKGVQQELENYIPKRKLKELIRYVSMGEVGNVNDWFLDFHQNIEKGFLAYPPAFTKFCWYVYLAVKQNERCENLQVFPDWKFYILVHEFDGFKRCKDLEVLLHEICHMMKADTDAYQEIATKAIAYMKVHFKEPINLEFLAEKCKLSPSYFSRKFKEQTGENYIDVLTDIRIGEAQTLLSNTTLSISEIVQEVGYCDDKHFRRLFLKVTGMKPSAYRKKIKEKAKSSSTRIKVL